MASARAAPRGSSRSRHSFPVADCDTPRKACGASTGNADAGSVMMTLANRQDGPPFNDSRRAAATYTRHSPATVRVILRCEPLGEPRRMETRYAWPILRDAAQDARLLR